jgi:hypothetical protein
MARKTVQVTLNVVFDGDDVEDYHPSYAGRIVETGLQKTAQNHGSIASWQIIANEEVK